MIAEQLWILSLDGRGGPRVPAARAAVTAGLMLDLESARLIEWRDDTVRRIETQPPAGPLGWAWQRLDGFTEPSESRFALDAVFEKAWSVVGDHLVTQGVAKRERRRFSRRHRYALTDAATRSRLVREVREVLFDASASVAARDPRVAVLSACSVGEEVLSLTPFTDRAVSEAFGEGRGEGPLEAKVWAAAKHECLPFYSIPNVVGHG